MERGFIKAEVIQWDELVGEGSFVAAREHGKVRVEGKDYVMQDGDVVLFVSMYNQGEPGYLGFFTRIVGCACLMWML